MFDVNIKIKQIGNGVLPVYKREGDACLDCCSRKQILVSAGSRRTVPLGFALELPSNYEAIVRPRSGLSRDGIDVAIGTIDSNYRGEVMACIMNNSEEDFQIEAGDRICQLAVREVPQVTLQLVSQLSETERGENGFGSSGLR